MTPVNSINEKQGISAFCASAVVVVLVSVLGVGDLPRGVGARALHGCFVTSSSWCWSNVSWRVTRKKTLPLARLDLLFFL